MKYSIGTHNDFLKVSFSRFRIELRIVGANAGSNGYRKKHTVMVTKNYLINESMVGFTNNNNKLYSA